jgi:hypothetical protein
MTTQTYRIVRYAADGTSTHEGEIVARGLSLAEAKAQADHGHGSWTPPSPEELDDGSPLAVIGYHESAAQGCGGYLVVVEEG